MQRARFVLSLLGGIAADVAQEAWDDPLGTAVNPITPIAKGSFKAVSGFLASAGFDQFMEMAADGQARRNHHLKFALASSLRVALAESKLAPKHERLFTEWDWMLERATKEQQWLDWLFSAEALEATLGAANEYRAANGAEPALRDLLKSWLERPLFVEPEHRGHYDGLSGYWSPEAEGISGEVLPAFQRTFTQVVSGDAEGHLKRAFDVKTLLRIDENVRDVQRRVIAIDDKVIDRDEMEAIMRRVLAEQPKPAGERPEPEALPETLLEWQRLKGFSDDELRRLFAEWERRAESEAQAGDPEAKRELALAAYARRELDRAAELAAADAEAAEDQLEAVEEKRRALRRQAWESRVLQGRALADQWRFTEAMEAFRAALRHVDEGEQRGDWADTQRRLGIVLQEQGIRAEGAESGLLLAESVAAYRSALEVYTRAELPRDWAKTQNNLGNALQAQGKRTAGAPGAELLGQAVAAYRRAFEVHTREELPQDWAMTQNNMGNALVEQGVRTGGAAGAELLGQAVAAYRSALEIYTRAELPQNWATTQNNLGNALSEQRERTGSAEGAELLGQAVAAYRSALEVHTREELPQDWAMTQINLGAALRKQGERAEGAKGAELLGQAVAAYRCALEVYTRAELPQDWAMTQNNIGNALANRGIRTGGAEGAGLLGQAVAAYRCALGVRTREELPQDWAMSQNNLGLTLVEQGKLAEGEQRERLFGEAEAAYRGALEVWTEELAPHYRGVVVGNLEELEGLRGR